MTDSTRAEPVAHWCTYCQGVNAHNCQFNPNVPRIATYITTHTAPPQRQPLTEQEIMDGWRDECPPSASLDVFTDGVVFAERAHGITPEAS